MSRASLDVMSPTPFALMMQSRPSIVPTLTLRLGFTDPSADVDIIILPGAHLVASGPFRFVRSRPDLGSPRFILITSAAASMTRELSRLVEEALAAGLAAVRAAFSRSLGRRCSARHHFTPGGTREICSIPPVAELTALAIAYQLRVQVLETRLQQPAGQLFNYSDLGPDVLGWVVERISGQTLDGESVTGSDGGDIECTEAGTLTQAARRNHCA